QYPAKRRYITVSVFHPFSLLFSNYPFPEILFFQNSERFDGFYDFKRKRIALRFLSNGKQPLFPYFIAILPRSSIPDTAPSSGSEIPFTSL
ncbi:hypothetical protein, partial [Enterocloster bolteae]|uniref:hypothetical protein n=1 Tax=Enterocloster bolteae TaxID=208479 RepID=UPI001D08999D